MGPTEVLVVFAKAPVPGRVKTRLAAAVGDAAACAWYRRCVEHVLADVTQGPWCTQLWVDAADAVESVSTWLHMQPIVQQGSDLGARMLHATAQNAPARSVVIGTDAPDITSGTIRTAFDALREYDVVIGPAYDGGYYLIGMREPMPVLFDGIDWSTDRVMSQTLLAAAAVGASVHVLSPLRDIDTIDDLQCYRSTNPTSPLSADYVCD